MQRAHHPAWMGKSNSAGALLGFALLVAPGAGTGGAEDQPKPVVKSERFDKDPSWEGHNNRLLPRVIPTITQDFGYSPTQVASQARGEVGGKVVRCSTPSYYAAKLAGKTLNDKLTASGRFALKGAAGSSGVFFGWFHSNQPGGGGRPVQSLGMDFDGEPSGARLAVRMINRTNKSCGTFITPFIPGKFRPTPIRLDGTRYSWTLDYDPEANGGNGRFRFTIQSHSTRPEPLDAKLLPADFPEAHKKEALSHFPNTASFSVDLPAGFKEEGATFDRFGLVNLMKPGNPMSIYFGDLQHDGLTDDLTKGPGWVGSNNRAEIEAVPVGSHDFGFSKNTNYAGGQPGEVGGDLWRSGKYGYYADRVGPLTLDDRLEARGKVVLKVGAPDSDIYIGWFSGAGKEKPPAESGNFVGVHVGGPTRVGHYFLPQFATAKGTKGKMDRGPVLTPGKVFDWSLVYDPAANGGQGEMRVTLDKETATLRLKPGQKAEGASLDRFGLFTSPVGGQLVRIFLDDLEYTALRGAPGPAARTLEGHSGSVLAVAFSPDGKVLASSSRDQTVKLWDAQTGRVRRTLTDHTGDVFDVVFSPKGDLLASGSRDKLIKLWDAQTDKVIRTLEGHGDIVRSVAFSPDQKTLASGSVDLTVRLWDVPTGQLKRTLKGHTARVMSVAYSPDGRTLASASSDRTVRLWDVRTGEEEAALEGHGGGVEALAFSPDGKPLASSSQDGTVRLWDIETGKMRHVLKGHVGEVDSVTFSPNGKTVVSGCKDRSIKVWDARTGHLRRSLTGHTGRVESLTFSPDGRTLATGGGGGDTSIRLWDMTGSLE